MVLYFIIVEMVIVLFLMFSYIHKQNWINRPYYCFFRLKDTVLSTILNEYSSLSKQDFKLLMELLIATNFAISNHKKYKTILFKPNRLENYLNKYVESSAKFGQAEIERIDDKNVAKLFDRYKTVLHCAFVGCTPFLSTLNKFKFIINALDKIPTLHNYVNNLLRAIDLETEYKKSSESPCTNKCYGNC